MNKTCETCVGCELDKGVTNCDKRITKEEKKMETSKLMPWQKRVVEEAKELDAKVEKLDAFLSSESTIEELSEIELDDLRMQLCLMQGYYETLHRRIGRFEQPCSRQEDTQKDTERRNAVMGRVAEYGQRPITAVDVINEADRNYDLGLKHGREEREPVKLEDVGGAGLPKPIKTRIVCEQRDSLRTELTAATANLAEAYKVLSKVSQERDAYQKGYEGAVESLADMKEKLHTCKSAPVSLDEERLRKEVEQLRAQMAACRSVAGSPPCAKSSRAAKCA